MSPSLLSEVVRPRRALTSLRGFVKTGAPEGSGEDAEQWLGPWIGRLLISGDVGHGMAFTWCEGTFASCVPFKELDPGRLRLASPRLVLPYLLCPLPALREPCVFPD